MCLMSDTSDTTTTRSSTATAPAPVATEAASHRTPWVFKLAAWVATIAGIVFIIAVVFFSGFILGHRGGHHGGHHHKHHAMMMHPHRFGGPGGPGGPGGRDSPGRWARVRGTQRPRTQPDSVVGRSVPHAVGKRGEP